MLSKGTAVCFVARHGETVLNATNSFRGNANPPLNDTGIKEAHELAKFLESFEISHVISSDKQRATKTAEIIAKAQHTDVHQTPFLRALNVGKFSGQKRTPESEAELQSCLDDPDCKIPDGESLNEFKARIHPCITEAIDLFCQSGIPPLIVAHSSIVHEVGSMLRGSHKALLVEPGGAIAIFFNGSKLDAEQIFKPLLISGTHAETIT
jgi:broad specificity phosphatase PhoE